MLLMWLGMKLTLLCCVCVSAGQTLNSLMGESVVLPSGIRNIQEESITTLGWYNNSKLIARLSRGRMTVDINTQFHNRLKMDTQTGSLTVRTLRLQDGGLYTLTGMRGNMQMPIHPLHLKVYEPISSVQIQSEISWVQGNSTCQVYLLCSSTGDRSASYRWEGQQEGSGTHLHFSLSPVEGDIKLTCTAANPATNSSREVTLTCRPPPGNCTLKALIFSLGLACMLSSVLAVHLREQSCRSVRCGQRRRSAAGDTATMASRRRREETTGL